ncbi:MAG: hypothetical protein M3134_07930 [Actinomycetota bacterium]|nr:hypothetical protein [Actinomycetota bacterium]
MAAFTWKLRGPSGEELRESETFESQADAEAWMGAHWSALLDEGAESVSLIGDGETIYDMGLREA